MQQIGIDICSLPEADGLKHLVACINYYSEWSKPVNPSRPNHGQREKIKLNFYFKTTFRNARDGKG